MNLYRWERWTLGLILAGVGALAAYVSIFHGQSAAPTVPVKHQLLRMSHDLG
jgi:hypothetical protein